MRRFLSIVGAVLGVVLSPSLSVAQQVPTTLRQEMPYAQARQILMDAGWQAAYRSPMRERYAAMDYLISELGYHEVVNCSGTGMGFCLFEFTDAYGQKLSVTTVRNDPRSGPPTVYGWRVDTETTTSAAQTSSTCVYRLKPETNIRTGPSTSSGVVANSGSSRPSDPITVHSTETGRDGQNWSWITFNYGGDETPGWVRSDLIVCQ